MDCIYLAAGLGVRMRKRIPKQFLNIYGKPIMIYALEVLEKISGIERIFITYHQDFRKDYERVIEDYNISKCILTEGGETRQESVWNALQMVESERVIIHEAARPFITAELVSELMEIDEKAVVPTIPVPFTVSMGNEYMTAELDRSKLHNIQLPQIFDTDILVRAHKKAMEEGYIATEDGILVFRLGEKVRFVKGLENNIKITTPLDLVIAENLLRGIEI
ncbi:MAG: 2-C-methyl-D-erythritol 4-phosphate cytidylyltransferase [Candidatus Marinimicrobia bacterium]|nr:2-C-methyl-D-erythritol 4-phosphate cytidylyltransferase [Candidatus Neomarinimicrobiota bacterium]